MKISSLITALQATQAERGDIEVKLDIDGSDCDPDLIWCERKQLVYLW